MTKLKSIIVCTLITGLQLPIMAGGSCSNTSTAVANVNVDMQSMCEELKETNRLLAAQNRLLLQVLTQQQQGQTRRHSLPLKRRSGDKGRRRSR